jgi:hypothetical protein
MNNILSLIFSVAFISISTNHNIAYTSISQTLSESVDKVDYININDFYIKSATGLPVKLLNLTPAKLKLQFGKPIQTKKTYGEMSEAYITTYFYKQIKASFIKDKLEDLHISNENCQLIINKANINNSITIGSSYTEIKRLFPSSWASKKDNYVSVSIKSPLGKITDASLGFLFDKNFKVVDISFNN